MKIIFNILTSIFFLIATSGVIINKHYSDGELYSTAFFVHAESCCENLEDCCSAHRHDCSEETEYHKLTQEYNASQIILDIDLSSIDIELLYTELLILKLDNHYLVNKYHPIDPPPPDRLLDLIAERQVFIL